MTSPRERISLPMTEPTLKNSAIEYAGYWFKTERNLVAGLSSDDRASRLRALQRATGYFKIARNMPRAYDVGSGHERMAPALAILEPLRSKRVSEASLGQVVESLRHEIGAAYGGRDLLSAATKFLWLLHSETAVIYDSRVRRALGTPYADYDAYLARWRAGYARCDEAIRCTCTGLPSQAVSLSSGSTVSDGEIEGIVAQEWFRRRVYDIYLWRRGAP